MSWTGTAKSEDGVWTLETEDGKTLRLHGSLPDNMANLKVEVDGQEIKGADGETTGIQLSDIKPA